ncbi:Putative zinc-or iron-chelating domain-containing protein [Desulfacinum hydrothermale DSM 13146]|uniref:Putative zinc-or iron-chelating domain-containing protein n=1 Tax=Desulfacinum hydrothermale DSM 13146 TaxID=1121390 RepID=A0A1W1XMS3_9BACT|nr:YkgJ family cysteine cluster protein [Desulfacinum hydrothermale]SMC25137.1 Putative zinc-or iron-chelating domain-containing protein [Desulfacinum hydrothermale DSM 13146]
MKTRRSARGWHRILRHRAFPLTYLERNLARLIQEGQDARRPVRYRRALWASVVGQRACWFVELTQDVNAEGQNGEGNDAAGRAGAREEPIEAYCDRCGMCCEIASGYPDFSSAPGLSDAWKRLFREGLGPGHRFCPFLLEDRARGRSACAIHPRRPNPCRIFEADECRALKAEVAVERASNRAVPPVTRRTIRRLVETMPAFIRPKRHRDAVMSRWIRRIRPCP